MRLTAKRIGKALDPNDFVYIASNGKIRRTRVLAVEPLGLDTENDFLPYDEHGENWWLTFNGAKKAIPGKR